MRAIVLALLVAAVPARAEDFPVLEQGQAAPTKGLLMPEAKAIELAQKLKGCEVEVEELRKLPPATPAAVVVGAVAGLVVGAVLGGVVVYVVKK
jgi:hypothetical protein